MTEGVSQKLQCFVVSVIGADESPERIAANKVLKHIIRKSLEPAYNVVRGDESDDPGAITPQIIESIAEADLVVADLTGENANVFYELAIAHGYQKPTIHLLRKGDSAPFDVKDMRFIKYTLDPDDIETAVRALSRSAALLVDKQSAAVTPLSAAGKFLAVEATGDPVAEMNADIFKALSEIQREMRGLRRHNRPVVDEDVIHDVQLLSLRDVDSMLDRIHSDGRLHNSDFESLVTASTTNSFDQWLRERYVLYFPDDIHDTVDHLYDPALLTDFDEGD